MEMTSSSWTDPGDESAVTETSTHISSGAIVGQTPRLVVSSHNVANKEVSPHQMGIIGSWASASWVIIKAYFAWFILVDDKSTIFKERAHEASPKQLLAPPTPNHRWLQNKPRTASLNSKLTLRTPEGRGLFKNARCPQWPDLFFQSSDGYSDKEYSDVITEGCRDSQARLEVELDFSRISSKGRPFFVITGVGCKYLGTGSKRRSSAAGDAIPTNWQRQVIWSRPALWNDRVYT